MTYVSLGIVTAFSLSTFDIRQASSFFRKVCLRKKLENLQEKFRVVVISETLLLAKLCLSFFRCGSIGEPYTIQKFASLWDGEAVTCSRSFR